MIRTTDPHGVENSTTQRDVTERALSTVVRVLSALVGISCV